MKFGHSREEVFNLINAQMKSREASAAVITNSAMTYIGRPKRKPARSAAPDPREKLAVRIEQSELTIEQIAKRSRVDQDQIESFIGGDGEALTTTEMQRIEAALDVVSEMEATATRIRNLSNRGRTFR